MVELSPARGGLYRRGFAGDTFNAAWYARRCLPASWNVSFGTVVGRDAVSQEMVEFIGASGIGTEAIRKVGDRTVGLYMISLKDGERSFSYWRGQSAARLLGADPNWLDRMMAGRDFIHFSGITLAILPVAERADFMAALGRARQAGARISFDTNIRPRLWTGTQDIRTACEMAARVSDIVLPSFDEEQAAFGDTTPDDTIARYAGGGASVVVVKNGSAPIRLWERGARDAEIPVAAVADVVDTTAAGDSFAGAFLAGLAQGKDAEAAARSAAAIAGRVIQAPGALVEIAS